MIIERSTGPSCVGCLGFSAIAIIALMTLSLLVLVAVGIGASLYFLGKWLFVPQERLFGAWSMSRWTMAHEQAFFTLEDRFGVDFSSTPLQLLVGSVTISLMIMTVLNFGVILLGVNLGLLLPILGVGIGFMTATHLSSPPQHWFASSSGGDLLFEEDLSPDDITALLGE